MNFVVISDREKKENVFGSSETVKLGSPCNLNAPFDLYDFQERAHEYYAGMTKEQFKKMQEFIAGRNSKKTQSKL